MTKLVWLLSLPFTVLAIPAGLFSWCEIRDGWQHYGYATSLAKVSDDYVRAQWGAMGHGLAGVVLAGGGWWAFFTLGRLYLNVCSVGAPKKRAGRILGEKPPAAWKVRVALMVYAGVGLALPFFAHSVEEWWFFGDVVQGMRFLFYGFPVVLAGMALLALVSGFWVVAGEEVGVSK